MTNAMAHSTMTGIFLAILGLSVSSELATAQDGDKGFPDYASYAEMLRTRVDDKGMVDYERLKARPAPLLAYLNAIATAPRSRYDLWDNNTKIAFWVNAYNGLTLQAIIDHYPIRASFLRSLVYPKNSIRQISGVWDELQFTVMGRKMTLDHIEHEILRVEFNEPRIHMALVCAAMGCPALRNEPYVSERLEQQLDDQTRRFLGDRDKFRIDRSADAIYLSSIFKWFGEDFVETYAPPRNLGRHDKETSAVLNFVAGYLEEADQRYVRSGDFRVRYLDYDWSLNERKVRR